MRIAFKLTARSRNHLQSFKRSGRHSQREFNRAAILLFLDKGVPVSEISNLLEVDRTTIWRIKHKYLTHGLAVALKEESRPGQPQKYTTRHEAELTALACGPVPGGRRRWTIRLLAAELNKQNGFGTITYGSVRKILKKTNLSLG